MPIDRSIPRFECGVCHTLFGGRDDGRSAAEVRAQALACERSGGTTVPLPPDTWVVEAGTGPLRLLRVGSGKVVSGAGEATPGHVVRYAGVDDAGTQAPYADFKSSQLWPHRPGVVNIAGYFGLTSNRFHMDHLESLVHDQEVADQAAAALQELFGAPVGGPDVRRAVSARRLGLLGPVLRQPGPKTLEVLAAVCAPEGAALAQITPEDESAWRGTLDGHLYQAAWLLALSRCDVAGDPNRAFAWTLRTNRQALYELVAGTYRAWWDGADVRLPRMLLQAGRGGTAHSKDGFTPTQRRALHRHGVDLDQLLAAARRSGVPIVQAAIDTLVDPFAEEVPMDTPARLLNVARVVAVASGKGGVGKSTVAAALVQALQAAGRSALLVDVDYGGPSQMALCGLPPHLVAGDDGRFAPHRLALGGPAAVSVGQLAPAGQAFAWRGPTAEIVLRFWLGQVDTSGFDTVVVDLPPGTNDVLHVTLAELRPDAVLLVTTGDALAHADGERTLDYLQRWHHRGGVPVAGVVENLSRRDVTVEVGGRRVITEARLFGEAGATQAFAVRHDVPYLGSLPFVPDPAALAATAELRGVADAIVGIPDAAAASA
jgi:Mrp family chromosome partitioning ATPase